MTPSSFDTFIFFFNDTATTEIYTLSLHDALPISTVPKRATAASTRSCTSAALDTSRSEEHTSELQSRQSLVCRLLLEKKNTRAPRSTYTTRRERSTRKSRSRTAG